MNPYRLRKLKDLSSVSLQVISPLVLPKSTEDSEIDTLSKF